MGLLNGTNGSLFVLRDANAPHNNGEFITEKPNQSIDSNHK